MALTTKADKLSQDNEEEALGFFEQMLGVLPDPRPRQGLQYPLRTVVVTALMAMVCVSDDAVAMQLWGEANAEWLGPRCRVPIAPPGLCFRISSRRAQILQIRAVAMLEKQQRQPQQGWPGKIFVRGQGQLLEQQLELGAVGRKSLTNFIGQIKLRREPAGRPPAPGRCQPHRPATWSRMTEGLKPGPSRAIMSHEHHTSLPGRPSRAL